jgi:dTDP-4-amino-4,6-dideoxygalactose transaminase
MSDGSLGAGGSFGRRCAEWLERETGCKRAFLTPSGTHALEMAAVLSDVGSGDEVIMPSWTFVSTAAAFTLRGARPVWVDVRPDTLNLDEALVEAAVTERTRVVVAMHYGGIGCEMDALAVIAARHRLTLVEDAAHAILATYRGRALGSLGDLGCFSFDEQKNVTCGEGGALLVADRELSRRAELVQEKGTTRAPFMRGEAAEYTWVDSGSAWAAGELAAAFLYGQLERAEAITRERMRVWNAYHDAFESLERAGTARRPVVPEHCEHNAHLYYLLLDNRERRDALIDDLARRGVVALSHYTPLHSTPAGVRKGREHGNLMVTRQVADCVVRLPLWAGLADQGVERVIDGVLAILG